ncbi:hypothetical protein [Methanoregula sp.]|uniref:DUF7289 family protein n=1 Tax=Methanoregula sp. TaxID=2052170 RepID=UPI000CC9A870|nr:hypothetical protein [Methanoregula sp.]PKG33550.1 MAG: hypothetical protein CW742_02365 [Methanoregula sp.]
MTKRKIQAPCTEGVSESIGFLLIFTLMMAGIGLVTLYGYPLLMQQQTSADEQIMEKNMIVLQNDVKSLAYKTVPYKETSLKIGGGALTIYNSHHTPPASKITIRDANGVIFVTDFRSGDLTYSSASANTEVSLQNGAVVKRQNQGSVMLAEPRWFYDGQTKTLVINLVNLTSNGLMARDGIGTVQMALGETRFDNYDTTGLVPIYLTYTPDSVKDYSVAWDNYLRQTLGMSRNSGTPGSGTGQPLEYELPQTSRLVIKQYEVIIRSL